MYFNAILVTGLTLLTTSLANPLAALENRQAGACSATVPCPSGFCCSQYGYCGTGPQYCQPQTGTCVGGVGGTCAAGLCCSPYGYCGTGVEFCGKSTTTTKKPTTTPKKTTVSPPTPTATLVNQYDQCGGQGWTGSTVCKPPYVCTYFSVWYSNCK